MSDSNTENEVNVNEVVSDNDTTQLTKTEDMSQEMMDQVDLINELLNTDIIDHTTALNILINVSSSLYHNEALNDLDRTLITKAFDSIQNAIEKGENFHIKLENDEDVKKSE
jgi:hypothetical protein